MFSKFFAAVVVTVVLFSVVAGAASTFILFQNATTEDMVTKFGVSNRSSTITQDDLPYLAMLLSSAEIKRVAEHLQTNASIVDTATLYNNDGINLSNGVIDRVLVFYALTENRK